MAVHSCLSSNSLPLLGRIDRCTAQMTTPTGRHHHRLDVILAGMHCVTGRWFRAS